MPAAPNRRYFRYSLRTLLVLVTLFACWLGYCANWIRQRREYVASHPLLTSPFKMQTVENGGVVKVRADAPWPLRVLGEEGVGSIAVSDQADLIDTRWLRALFPEAQMAHYYVDHGGDN